MSVSYSMSLLYNGARLLIISIFYTTTCCCHRFVDELDYEKEVKNCELFRKQMTDTGALTLGDVIVVPKMYTTYCTPTVLVSEWIEGTKLNKIDVSEEKGRKLVQKLTQVLLNCYLVQLLETGFLHSDPHPGKCSAVQ